MKAKFREVNVTRVDHERPNKSTSFVTCAIFFLVLIRGGNLNKSTIICIIWTPGSQVTYWRGSSGILVMADTDKLNIDSIIARLLEGKFWLLDMSNNLSSSSSGWKRWKTVALTYAIPTTSSKTLKLYLFQIKKKLSIVKLHWRICYLYVILRIVSSVADSMAGLFWSKSEITFCELFNKYYVIFHVVFTQITRKYFLVYLSFYVSIRFFFTLCVLVWINSLYSSVS